MTTFRIVFTTAMLLAPAVFMMFYRPRHEEVDMAVVNKRRNALWLGTALAVGFYALSLIGTANGWFGFWAELPKWMTVSETPDQLGWLLFFPLWFGLGMPLLIASRPEAATPYPKPRVDGDTRSASLSVRDDESPIGPYGWFLGWVIWAGAAIAVLLRATAVVSGPEPDARLWASAIVFLSVALLPMLIGPWCVRASLREPEPLDPGGSRELVDAYARHRSVKARGLLTLQLLMLGLFAAFAVAVVYAPDAAQSFGWVGGIAGALIGVWGAAFGVLMGNQRMRIKRLLDRLTAEQG